MIGLHPARGAFSPFPEDPARARHSERSDVRRTFDLSILDESFAVCRLDPHSEIPGWALTGRFFSITRTPEELSIVCREAEVPPGIVSESGWRGLKIEGPFDFGEVGVLLTVTAALADAGISILAISTFDTDYVLLKGSGFEAALSKLEREGHRILHRP